MSKTREPVIFRYYTDDVFVEDRTYSRFVYRPVGEPAYIGANPRIRRMLVSDDPPVVEMRFYRIRALRVGDVFKKSNEEVAR